MFIFRKINPKTSSEIQVPLLPLNADVSEDEDASGLRKTLVTAKQAPRRTLPLVGPTSHDSGINHTIDHFYFEIQASESFLKDWEIVLKKDKGRSYYQCFVTWMTMDSWLIKGLVACLASLRHMRETDGPCCVAEFSKPLWPRSHALPFQNWQVIRRMNAMISLLNGMEFMVGNLWSSVLLIFKINDVYNRLWNPHCGPQSAYQWLKEAPRYSLLSNLLLNLKIWPVALSVPLFYGVSQAFFTWLRLSRVMMLSDAMLSIIKTEDDKPPIWLDTLVNHRFILIKTPSAIYFSGRNAQGCWVVESTTIDAQDNDIYLILNKKGLRFIREIDHNLSPQQRKKLLHYIATQLNYRVLDRYESSCLGNSCGAVLPWGENHTAIHQISINLQWDGACSHDDRVRQLDYLEQVAFEGDGMVLYDAIWQLATVAHAHAHIDLEHLFCQGLLSQTQFHSLRMMKARALHILERLAEGHCSLQTAFQKFWVAYNRWHLGHNRNPIMHLVCWLIKGWKLYAKIMLTVQLYQGLQVFIKIHQEKQACERKKGHSWNYLAHLKTFKCSVCRNFNVPYAAIENDVSCWEALLSSPRQASTVVQMIRRLNMRNIDSADFSRQLLNDHFIQTVFPALQRHTYHLPVVYLGSAIQPIQIRLNHSALILAQALESMNTRNLTAYWDSHLVISHFMEYFPKTLRYARLFPQTAQYLYISGQSAAMLVLRFPVDTLLLHAPGSVGSPVAYYRLSLKNSSRYDVTLSLIEPSLQAGVSLFLAQFMETLQGTIQQSLLKHLRLNHVMGISAPNFIPIVAKIVVEHALLETLSLSSNRIDNKTDAEALSQALVRPSSLKHLDLSDTALGSKGTEIFHIIALSLCKNKDLLDIDLYGSQIGLHGTQGTEIFGQCLCDNPFLKLKYVRLGHNYLSYRGTRGTEVLVQCLHHTDIEYLDLSRNYFGFNRTQDDEKALGLFLCKNKALKVLRLDNNNLGFHGTKGMEKFGQCLDRDTVLKSLYMINNYLSFYGEEGIKMLLMGLTTSSVRYFNVSGNWIRGPESVWIEALSQLQGVVWDISHNYFTRKAIYVFQTIASKHNNTLVGLPQYLSIRNISTVWGSNHSSINLSNERIGQLSMNETLVVAQKFVADKNVQSIDLTGNFFGYRNTTDVEALAKAFENTVRQSVNLTRNQVSNQGTRGVENIGKNLHYVRYLGLRWNHIGGLGPKGMRELGYGLINNTFLEILDLGRNKIGKNGTRSMEALSLGLNNNAYLRVLYLNENQIGEYGTRGVEALGWGLNNNINIVLEILNLGRNKIGKNGIRGVRALTRSLGNNTSLRDFNASYNPINCVSEYSQQIFYDWVDILPSTSLKIIDLSHFNKGFSSGCHHNLTFFAIDNATAYQLLIAVINSAVQIIDFTGSLNSSQKQPLAVFLQPFKRPLAIYNHLKQHLDQKQLDLSFHQEVGQHWMPEIASNLPVSHWTQLILHWSSVNTTGVQLLILHLAHSHLITLDLRYNNIDDDGAKSLAKVLVQDSTSLCSIPLLKGLTSNQGQHKTPATPLQHLLLAGNRIGPAGIDALCRALPFTPISVIEVGLYEQNNISASDSLFDPVTCRSRTLNSVDQGMNLTHQAAMWSNSLSESYQHTDTSIDSSTFVYEVEWVLMLSTTLILLLLMLQSIRTAWWSHLGADDSSTENIESPQTTPSKPTTPLPPQWVKHLSFFNQKHSAISTPLVTSQYISSKSTSESRDSNALSSHSHPMIGRGIINFT